VSIPDLRSFRAKSSNAGTDSPHASLDFARDERVLVLALSSLLLIAASPQTAVEAERDFAARAQTEGMWTAFRATAAPGAIMFVPQQVRAHDFLKDRKDPLVGYMWWPAQAFVSCDGNTAVTTGPSVLGASRGYFTTLWHKQEDGSWKWELDHGAALTSPRPAGEEVSVKRASCNALPKSPWVIDVTNADRIREAGQGRSEDESLKWNWAIGNDGSRIVTASIWNGSGYDVVVRDVVAAPKQ
jgi:hypothetical protein